MLKGLLSELMFANIGVSIPTYVRNDNSVAVYQVDSVNTATNEKRSNGFLRSNRGELGRNDWLSVCYIPGDMNTPDGLTNAASSANIRNLLTRDTFRIVTESKKEIWAKIPASKHYIV